MSRPIFRAIFGAILTSFVTASFATAQEGTIRGSVRDATTGSPLASAEISFSGESRGLSDAQGSFSIRAPAGRLTLAVTLIGYAAQRLTVEVPAGGTVEVNVALIGTQIALEGVTVTAGRERSERSLQSLPTAADVRTAEEIEVRAAPTVVDYVKDMPGVDAVQTGVNTSNTVTRGFNNVFSGALLVMTDNRWARVPSLRLNAYNMIPAPTLDVERVEVFLGPASALYGPNSTSGVMHIITSSPIDKPGTTVSVSAGDQGIFTGAFRQNFRFSDRLGLKVTGQYFTGTDFRYTDPVERAARASALAQGARADTLKIGARDFNAERWGGEVRLDYRPWEGSTDGLKVTLGTNSLGSSIDLTGLGAGQAQDWTYRFGQVQFERAGLFVQAFMNRSNAGSTYLLRTGAPIVDESSVLAAQAQYSFGLGSLADVVAGVDYSQTTPETLGTINGVNEDMDETQEVGGYVSTTLHIGSKFDLIGAVRMDDHQHLPDPVVSPRAGLVYRPASGQVFRGTFNRSFSTPTSNNLFLDLTAGFIPIVPGVGYRVQASGVPSTGFTWNDTCAGGVNNYCMYSPFNGNQAQLPATGTVFWNTVVIGSALQNPTLQATLGLLGLTPAQFAAIVGSPSASDIGSYLLRFNSEDLSNPFVPDPGVTNVSQMLPTIHNTLEVGYQGIFAQRFKFDVSLYKTRIQDFVGPLRVETPSVFLNGADAARFITTRLAGAGVPLQYAQAIAASIAPIAAQIPFGTVAPDQRATSDLILTYRNFGDVEFTGADFGFEAYLTDNLTMSGTYSYVSDECFDVDGDGACTSAADVALNAPRNKGSLGLLYRDARSGFEIGARGRYTDGFIMNSGVYVGDVDSYLVFDSNLAYRIPRYEGLLFSLTVNNMLGSRHREFVGAPEIGRLALFKLQYSF
jgi:outer membrane receptor for ferrienterochelin and colicins